MHTKYTPANVILILFAIIVSTLLVLSKIYYWQLIDFFALPFFESFDLAGIDTPYFGYMEIPRSVEIYYSVVMQYLNSIKSQLLDILINIFGYEINIPFIAAFTVVFVLGIIYVFIRYKNKAAYIPFLCCFIGGVIFTLVMPAVTIEQVGLAMFAENDYVDSEVNYLDLLRSGKYSELDKRLNNVERNFSTNAIGEYQYIDEYEIFETATKDDLIYFEHWLNQTTNKKVVLISRGMLYEQLGWDARGRKFSRETSEKEFTKMREYFSKAVKDHYAVLDINNKSLLSYASLLNMAAAYDFDTDKETLFKQGINDFPTSYNLASMYMHKLQPKWGGSYRKIRSVAMRMREQAVNNPMLISLSNYELAYRARELRNDKDDTKHVRLKRFTMFYGVPATQVLSLALYYDDKNDTKNAINILSQGLKFHPDNAELLANRAHYYVVNDNISSAASDVKRVTPDGIYNSWISDKAAGVYDKLHQPEKSIPFYLRSIELDPKSEYPYNRLYWLSYKKVMGFKEVLPYMKKWTDLDPESSDAWISYAATLKEIDPKSSIPAYRKFLEYANRKSSIDMTAVRYVEKLIKDLESKQ